MFVGYDLHPRAETVWEVWESGMRIDDRILSCIVFLGRDDNGPFVAYGTGFLAVTSYGGRLFQHIVTARHVVEQINNETICIRINRLDGLVEHTYARASKFKVHPDPAVDIAVCPTHVPPEQYDIKHVHMEEDIATEEVFADQAIGIGDDVFLAGLFTRHPGESYNSPVVRTGTLAALPRDKIQTDRGLIHGYLIEARSIAGLSGSPVFIHMAPFRVIPGGNVRQSTGKTHYFLGVLQGHFVTSDPTEVISEDEHAPGDMSTGIGVVIPHERVLDIMDCEEWIVERQAILEKLKQESGFVGDSATPAPPTTDENPRHKEDFNSLLNVAVKGPRSNDQT